MEWTVFSTQAAALVWNSIGLWVGLCIKDVRTETPSVSPQLDVILSGPELFCPAPSLLVDISLFFNVVII